MILVHLTIESPVGYRCYGDATLEHRAVGEEQERGKKSSIGLENNNNMGLKKTIYVVIYFSDTEAMLPFHKLQLWWHQYREA